MQLYLQEAMRASFIVPFVAQRKRQLILLNEPIRGVWSGAVMDVEGAEGTYATNRRYRLGARLPTSRNIKIMPHITGLVELADVDVVSYLVL